MKKMVMSLLFLIQFYNVIQGDSVSDDLTSDYNGVVVSKSLMVAAYEGSPQELYSLIVDGADVNYKDDAGMTPLMYAAQDNSIEKIDMLVAAGADVNAVRDGGWTVLMYAVGYASVESVDLLLSAGADVNARNNEGTTVLMCGVSDEISGEIVDVLLSAGAEVNVQNKLGLTALMYAAYDGLLQTVKLLVNSGADASLRNDDDQTAYDVAVFQEHADIAMFLAFE
ncbi:hypothetical protein HOM50_02335 [bacterium]|jgi:ankyrin repeat protein|nr:hypothetical protein [bacterium]MBT5015222.1 hypothetical protein [bacterium]